MTKTCYADTLDIAELGGEGAGLKELLARPVEELRKMRREMLGDLSGAKSKPNMAGICVEKLGELRQLILEAYDQKTGKLNVDGVREAVRETEGSIASNLRTQEFEPEEPLEIMAAILTRQETAIILKEPVPTQERSRG